MCIAVAAFAHGTPPNFDGAVGFFTGVGDLPGSLPFNGVVTALSPDGRIAVGEGSVGGHGCDDPDPRYGVGSYIFQWRNGMLAPVVCDHRLDPRDGNPVMPLNVTNSGSMIINHIRPFRWQDGVLFSLPSSIDGARNYGTVIDVSPDGTLAVGWGPVKMFIDPFNGPIIYTPAGATPLVNYFHAPELDGWMPRAMSADATTIVLGSDVSPFPLAIWKQGRGVIPITGPDGGTIGGMMDVSDDGTIAVGVELPSGHPFLWHADGTVETVPPLPDGGVGYPTKLSADSSTLVMRYYNSTGDGQFHIWRRPAAPEALPTMLARLGLNTQGWTSLEVTCISADGSVLGGIGANPCGHQQSWIARIPPFPVCPVDFNLSGIVSVQDIFDFLAAYFEGDQRADWNGSCAITVQDIFDFLAAYFTGCP